MNTVSKYLMKEYLIVGGLALVCAAIVLILIVCALRWGNPRWFYCLRCGCYRSDLGDCYRERPLDTSLENIETEICPQCVSEIRQLNRKPKSKL